MWTKWTVRYTFLIGILLVMFLVKTDVYAAEEVDITLEFAETDNELSWGLMGRDSLNDNSGMLFIFKTPRIISTWMYNTYIDLSIAFLDGEGRIKEIHHMQAFPEKMKRRLKPEELNSITLSDPVVAFFLRRSVASSFPAKYALEVNRGWFEKNHVSIGDVLIWQPGQAQAKIIRSS